MYLSFSLIYLQFILLNYLISVIYSLLDVDHDGLLHRNEINAFVRLALKSQGIEQQSAQIGNISAGKNASIVLNFDSFFRVDIR